MKLLVDMNLSPSWVDRLVRHGFEAVHWSTIGGPTPDRVPAVVLKVAPMGWVIAEDASGRVAVPLPGAERAFPTPERSVTRAAEACRDTSERA